jgi:CRISPR-associated protein Cmr3
MNIEITAFDTVFFKDGKPFTMGEDTWASGIFPPPPSVFYGMIRTAYAAQNNISLVDIVEETKNLKISSILLKYDYKDESHLLFPYPTDLFQPKEKEHEEIKLMKLKANNIISNISAEKYPYVLSPETNKKVEDNFEKAFLDKDSFEQNYLQAKDDDIQIKKNSDIIEIESKTGISKNNYSNQTDEGKLYRVGMIRPKVKFLIEFSNLELQKEGFFKIGAESKAAYYKTISENVIKFPEIKNEYLKIYLATPAIFKNGSIPEFIANGQYDSVDFELLTMAIGKPKFIGGFDMKENKPKPMKKAVPAGSVYYLRCDKAKELATKLHSKSISEVNPEQGFGICYCGTFDIDKL